MHRSRMFGVVVFVAIAAAAAPTYVMAETTTDKVEPKAKSAGKDAQAEISDWSLTAKTKIAFKNELTDNAAGREGSRLSTTGSRAQVVAMQQALKDKGFDPGPIDGTVGPRTAAALSSYQKAENPPLTGRMNPLPALLMRGLLFGDRHFPP
jgi:peptidoglycan hydrolase-like protein with peptidoglycan-binding domain